jgi:hypothetical protein
MIEQIKLYAIGALVVLVVGAAGVALHQHDAAVRADERASAATREAAALVPLERALHDTIRQLAAQHSADSAAAATAIGDWARVAHPPRVVVRVDTLPGRVDTVFAEGAVPKLPELIAAGDAAAATCAAAEASCARRAAALERDTVIKALRIARLEAATAAVAPRSCVAPTVTGTIVGGVLGGVSGYLLGRASKKTPPAAPPIQLGGFTF